MNLTRIVAALRFDRAGSDTLAALPDDDWRRLLDTADREHLTLALGLRCSNELPDWVRSRIQRNLAANGERFTLIRNTCGELESAFGAAGIDFVFLKGLSHWPCYSLDPRHRPQYDIDLLCLPGDVLPARDVLGPLGFEPLFRSGKTPLDHLPGMIRRTGWLWRGDYFDLDLPLAIEVHFRLWDSDTERIPAPGLEEFWERRTRRRVEDFSLPALDRADTVAYAALHLLRHLLRGDFRLYHAYELAHFLEQTSTDTQFWRRWHALHPAALRALEAIAFRLAACWFGCRLPAHVLAECEIAPEPVQRWFNTLAGAPLQAKRLPDKSELWLHLSLVRSAADRRSVLVRRLLPTRGHPALYAAHVPHAEVTPRLRFQRASFAARHAAGRFRHHLRSTLPTLAGGIRWWWAGKELDSQLLRFLAAASLFNFGMSIFFLLYNLLLLERGFHEDVIGSIASALSFGSVAGTLPAALVLRRLGIRTTLMTSFAGVALMCALRTIAVAPFLLVASAFAGGFLFALYAVSIAPVVAQFTTERSRPFGYSLVFSLGIGVGAVAGLIGGRLPKLLTLETVLLIACATAALGSVAAAGLRIRTLQPSPERRVYPRTGLVGGFLGALLVWNLATGAFNPFFNVFFANNLKMPVGEIGNLFSAAQIVQVGAILAAPSILRRFGAANGVVATQFATAAALAVFALGPNRYLAALVYSAYMAFQYMSEPGIYTLLMQNVHPHERSGMSALNYLVVVGGQAIAAAIAGFAAHRFGYGPVLSVAAAAAMLAAIALWANQRRSSTEITSARNLATVNRNS